MTESTYRLDEIKRNIDLAVQRAMLELNREDQDIIFEIQGRLYEMFGIID